MKKENNMGMTFEQLPEFKKFIEAMNKLAIDYKKDIVPYVRHTDFITQGCPPCVICGGNVLIHGMGRYVIVPYEVNALDVDTEEETYLCGYCEDYLEKTWKIKMDFQ